jgi:peptide/nickel transport system ATP-binding protein
VHCTLDQLVADSGRAALLEIQMIFQNPMASLNPRMRVADIIGEAPVMHGIVAKTEIDRHIDAQLVRLGLDPGYKSRYPHQFSSGQRARIGIARALEPDFLVRDESVAALDVSIKAQVLNLFMRLRDELRLTYLHQPRPRRGRAHLGPHRDHVSRPHRRNRADRGAVSRAESSLHPGAARQRAAARGPEAALRGDQGRAPLAARSTVGLPLPPTLPVRLRPLQRGRPALKEIAPGRWSACHFNDGEAGSRIAAGPT